MTNVPAQSQIWSIGELVVIIFIGRVRLKVQIKSLRICISISVAWNQNRKPGYVSKCVEWSDPGLLLCLVHVPVEIGLILPVHEH